MFLTILVLYVVGDLILGKNVSGDTDYICFMLFVVAWSIVWCGRDKDTKKK